MPKFKVGDEVRLVTQTGDSFRSKVITWATMPMDGKTHYRVSNMPNDWYVEDELIGMPELPYGVLTTLP